jgi:hypothetical protein
MVIIEKKKGPKKRDLGDINVLNKTITLDETITSFSDDTLPRRFRNPISLRWDDTTWI